MSEPDPDLAAASPVVILCRPQMGENIGTTARAMLNFGLTELRLVRPDCGWPNAKAVVAASGAARVLNGVRIFDDLKSALIVGYVNLIENIDFADGTVWSWTQLLQHYIDVAKTSGDDTILGGAGTDTIDAGGGTNDVKDDPQPFDFWSWIDGLIHRFVNKSNG